MARVSGVKPLPFSVVKATLKKERANCMDTYAPLSRVKVEIRNANAEVLNRYQLRLVDDPITEPLVFTPTSLRQLGRTTGVPSHVLERLPAAVGLNVLRCMLSVVHEKRPQRFLFRMVGGPRGIRLRALLPGSYVRFDDSEVLKEVETRLRAEKLKVVGLTINDDLFSVRLITPDRHNLGTSNHPDANHAGLDVRSSETARYPLQVRELFWRLVCSNGMTRLTDLSTTRIRQDGNMDKALFGEALGRALGSSMLNGGVLAARLGEMRTQYVAEPREEVERVFRDYDLGSPRGRTARWVWEELHGEVGLLGTRRFDLVQAFTSVAQRLDHDWRPRVEDAMGGYVWGEN